MSKQVTFIQNKVPGLKAEGEYTLTVQQIVSGENIPADEGQYQETKMFVVKGARFSFTPDIIHSVFPPANYQGEFNDCLSHVVLSRPILPWIRDIGGDNPSIPWLAVLLFDEDEVRTISYTKAEVQDLIPTGASITAIGNPSVSGTGQMPEGYLSYPFNAPSSGQPYVLDYGETPEDSCYIIDVPAALFNAIVPSLSDLSYLAHIRQVDSTSKTSQEKITEFSLVVGNRIPQKQGKSTVHLVSLEGLAQYLPSDTQYTSQLPDNINYVRLVSIKTWNFSVLPEKESFKKLLENLNTTLGNTLTTLQIPTDMAPPTTQQVTQSLTNEESGTLSQNDADVLVRNAYIMGYVGLNHYLRDGGNTVSWYRGPLLPYDCTTLSNDISFPISCSDAVSCYNPDTGLFDVSYSAAWQLGQLLALQSKSFSVALYQWKKTVLKTLAGSVEQSMLNETFDEVFKLLKGIKKDEINKKAAIIELISGQLELMSS